MRIDMGGIIDNIIRFYQMRSEALGIVVGNTGKALREMEREKKDNEETEKLQSFAENLTRDVNDTLTRFYSRKERKEKRYQRLSDDEVTALVDFADFTRILAVSVSSLLNRLRKNETFEGKLDEEIKQLETYVKKRIKEFDEVLEDALTGRGRMFIKRLVKRLGNVVSGVRRQRIGATRIDSGTPVFDGKGQMIEIRGTIADVPERNRAGNMKLSAEYETCKSQKNVDLGVSQIKRCKRQKSKLF
jgi:hypothetical protein